MDLLSLPNEMLHHIASYMDVDSLMNLGCINGRLLDVTQIALKSVKPKRVSRTVLNYLRDNRIFMDAFDLSDCEPSKIRVWDYAKTFYYLTKLNMGSFLLLPSSLLDILKQLENLEMLSCVLGADSFDFDLTRIEYGPFSSVRKLFIDTTPALHSFKFIAGLMNRCSTLEVSHIHIRGIADGRDGFWPTTLAAERWKTLHTFVCSLNLAQPQRMHRSFLRGIFHHKLTPEIENWINQDKEYFIYEHGHFNRNASRNIVVDNNVKLLKRIRCVDFSDVHYENEIFNWGSPASLRITCFARLLTEFNIASLQSYLSAELVELDLTECHGDYQEKFRGAVFVATPSLKVLAIPVCLFRDRKKIATAKRPKRRRLSDPFTEALQELRLRKLFVKGKCTVRCSYTYGMCACVRCEICAKALTSDDLIQLNGLKHLEELCFNGVRLADSAYENMANPILHTVRLSLSKRSSFSGLRDFIRGCTNLRNFKFEVLDGRGLPLHCIKFWQALVESRNLRKICLSATVLVPEVGTLTRVFLPQMSPKLEFIHFHAFLDSQNFFETIHRQRFLMLGRDTKIVFSVMPQRRSEECSFRFDARRYVEFIHEHSLCCSDSFVGMVKPRTGIANTADRQ